MQKAFVFDIDRCTGCQACQLACSIENQVAPEISWRQITTFNPQHHPAAASFHLSLACNHCVDAPCMKGCPADAYTKDVETGAVTINADSCIGCKYCAWACPYDAPQFNKRVGVMEKCTFCSHRLAKGMAPACVTACPTGALQFDDYHGRDAATVVNGFPRVDVEPAVHFVQPRGERRAPLTSLQQSPDDTEFVSPPSKISLRSEWSLVTFTLLAALLVGWLMTVPMGGAINVFGFAVLGAAAMVVSTLHLGRKTRAWRAILNWRTSWVSREIIFFSLFLGVTGLYLVGGQTQSLLLGASVAAGLCALFSIDQVYTVTATRGLQFHSARVMLVAPFLAGVLLAEPRVYLVLGGIRLVLYLTRKMRQAPLMTPHRWMFAGVRVLVGMALPAAWTIEPSGSALLPGAFVLVGEVIDRAEFYTELEISTPGRQASIDLEAVVRAAS